MMILDANILLYAYNADAPQHVAAGRWLEGLVQSNEIIALPWVTIWAFLWIATNHRIWANPLLSKSSASSVPGSRNPVWSYCSLVNATPNFCSSSSPHMEQAAR